MSQSPDNTVLFASVQNASGPSITDNAGNVWTLITSYDQNYIEVKSASGVEYQLSEAYGPSAAITVEEGTIYAETPTGLWKQLALVPSIVTPSGQSTEITEVKTVPDPIPTSGTSLPTVTYFAGETVDFSGLQISVLNDLSQYTYYVVTLPSPYHVQAVDDQGKPVTMTFSGSGLANDGIIQNEEGTLLIDYTTVTGYNSSTEKIVSGTGNFVNNGTIEGTPGIGSTYTTIDLATGTIVNNGLIIETPSSAGNAASANLTFEGGAAFTNGATGVILTNSGNLNVSTASFNNQGSVITNTDLFSVQVSSFVNGNVGAVFINAGSFIVQASTLTNQGVINIGDAVTGGTIVAQTTVTNTGYILDYAATEIDWGSLTTAAVFTNSSTIAAYGALTLSAAHSTTPTGANAYNGSFINTGRVVETGGRITFVTPVVNTNGIIAIGEGTVTLEGTVVGGTIAFNGGGTLEMGGINLVAGPGGVLSNVAVDLSSAQNATFLFDHVGTVAASYTQTTSTQGDLHVSSGAWVQDITTTGSASAGDFTVSANSVIFTAGHQALPTPAPLTIADATSGQTITANVTPYTGPVQGITSEFVTNTSDVLNVTATVPNMFIEIAPTIGGAPPSEAGIDVSAANGNNILDAYANSNFYTGGAGTDQFYEDARTLTGNSWSTVVNLHSGDNVTIWGITPNLFNLDWIGDTYGAPNATGLTGVFVPGQAGQPEAGVTLAGFTMSDLTNGRLSIGYNTIDGNAYASIHAN